MILDLIYGYSKPLEKASYYSKSKGRKEESIGRVFKKLILVKSSYTRNNYFEITFMFSAQSLLVGNGTSVTCLRKSREAITALNVATYVTLLMVRNFWLCDSHARYVLYMAEPILRVHVFFLKHYHLIAWYAIYCGRVGLVVRALAFHQCSQGSIFTLGVICGLSLLVAMRGFSPGTPFSPLIKYQHLTFDLI